MNPHSQTLNQKNASFFDLDHTLCKVNTSFRFGFYLMRLKLFPLILVPYFILIYFSCKAGILGLARLHAGACRHLFFQKSLKDIQGHVDNFLDLELQSMLSPEIFKRFERAKFDDHYTVLLSNSPDFIVESIAKRLQFNAWEGTKYSLDSNKKVSGISHILDGEDKAHYVKQIAKNLKISTQKMFAYSDSYLDLPFLESVGNPIAVNPDKKLEKIASLRNWTILSGDPTLNQFIEF